MMTITIVLTEQEHRSLLEVLKVVGAPDLANARILVALADKIEQAKPDADRPAE